MSCALLAILGCTGGEQAANRSDSQASPQQNSRNDSTTETDANDNLAIGSNRIDSSVSQSVVRVLNHTYETNGFGVVIGGRGQNVYILTVAHLASPQDSISISAPWIDDEGATHGKVFATCIAKEETDDIALLRVRKLNCPSQGLRLAAPDWGNSHQALTVWNVTLKTERQEPYVTVEEVATKWVRRSTSTPPIRVWESILPGRDGDSGSPIVNASGLMVGIRSGRSTTNSYFTHHSRLGFWISTWIRQGHFGVDFPKMSSRSD